MGVINPSSLFTQLVFTRMSGISIRRVLFPHEKCDFYKQSVIFTRCANLTGINAITHKSDFHMQTVISTRRVNLHTECYFTRSVILTRMRVKMTLTNVITTRRSQSVISKRCVNCRGTNVITTRTSVISMQTAIFTHRLCFYTQSMILHAECNFDKYFDRM
jgi:hypothetical protein